MCRPAAQFDLLATLFALLALIFSINRNSALVAACATLACLSKESAYALPLLIVCTAFFLPRQQRKAVFLNAGWSALACLFVFSYRLWFMQGMGGDQTSPRIIGILEALTFRIWSFLFVPVNWSIKPTLWIALAVFAVLLIGFDMSKSRLLYLPSVGVCLIWAVIAEGSRRASLLAAALACFQVAALWHNQKIWGETAELAKRTCLGAAERQDKNTGRDPPRVRKMGFWRHLLSWTWFPLREFCGLANLRRRIMSEVCKLY